MNVRRIVAGSVVAVLSLVTATTSTRAADEPAKDSKPIHALLVCGGCCHDYLHQKDIITKGISARANVVWTIAYDPSKTTSHPNPVYDNPDWAKGFDIVVHDECTADVKDLAFVEKVLKPHKEGLPAMVLHCGMHSYRTPNYPKDTPWFEFTGMNTNHHGPQIPISITFTDTENPIVHGMENWKTMQEELYHTESLAKTAHALATGEQKSNRYNDKNPVIWTNDYHGTRVFCTTIGHNNDTCNDPRYLDLLTRGMLWALNRLDDKGAKPAANAGAAPSTAVQAAAPAPTQAPAQSARRGRASARSLSDPAKIASSLRAPAGFDLTVYASPPTVNYPTCIAATPTGDLFIGIDEDGSLGKNPNAGRVLKCSDTHHDGKADKITVFATMDHPRGMVWDDGVLYVLHPPFLTAYYDDNGDGVSDRSVQLLSGISNERMVASRGADHTTNGIRMGIDGWIYIAMGDFGAFHAVEKDGTTVQIRGGGVARVRPDGTGLERYSWGQRNIYDVAIDPLMNVYTRDNTNDGDNWNDRLSYIVPTANYGYPSLFMNFKGEFVDCLADYGGGSPCGSLFVDEPGLPGGLYTVEWGRSEIDRHPLTASGANFIAGQQKVMDLPRGTDIDADGVGHLYASSWANGGFSYSGPDVGYVIRLTPKDYKPTTFPDLHAASDQQLVNELKSPSAVCRLATQRQILRRGDKPFFAQGLASLAQSDAPIASRVAAIFTLKLLEGPKADQSLAEISRKADVREFALRALADQKNDADAPSRPFIEALRDKNPRVRLVAAWGLGRLGRADAAPEIVPLLADSDFLVKHIAIRSLTFLRAYDACLKAIDPSTPNLIPGAVQVLQSLHETQVVDGLNTSLNRLSDADQRGEVYGALCRLFYREADWTGDWWGTRPDTSGPYYKTADWPGTDRVKQILNSALSSEKPQVIRELIVQLEKNKVMLPEATRMASKLAESDPAFRAQVVDLLSNRLVLSAEQVTFLKTVATSEKDPAVSKAKAIRALERDAGAPGAADALVESLSRVLDMEKPDAELASALDEFIRDPRNDRSISRFTKLTESAEPARRELGYAVLLNLATQRIGRNGSRFQEQASDAINHGWSSPKQAISLLTAIGRDHVQAYRDKVKSMESNSDAKVAQAATSAAQSLGLDRPSVESGPLIPTLSYEAVVSQTVKIKGDAKLGAALFTRQGCVICHTVSASEPPKGPLLAGIAKRYTRPELIESILKPSAKIAQGFETQYFKTADNQVIEGFVTRESGDEVEVRNATGVPIVIKKSDIRGRGKRNFSIMPEGLAANLTCQDLANLLAYLESLKSN